MKEIPYDILLYNIYNIDTLPETNIDPDNGPMEDQVPLPTSGFQGP